jgi:Tfp pilus assembly protein PilF
MRALFAMLGVALGAGCAATPEAPEFGSLFADERFARASGHAERPDIFTLDEPMLAFAETQVAARMRERGRQVGLAEALREHLRLAPDAATTRPAAETFEARSGNCLSLVILTAAFARHFGIPLQFQDVHTEGTWSRAAGLAVHSGHVNLRLGPPGAQPWMRHTPELVQTVDFLEPADPGRQYVRVITQERIVAMYGNNRAAEALVAGDLDAAYWHARDALVADPTFTAAYNTLGVLYRRHGDLRLAERALRRALAREPANAGTLLNLAVTLEGLDRPAEAAQLRERAAAIEPYPPFHFLDAGLAALAGGRYREALDLLQRELERMPYDDEVHFAIAVAHLQLGKAGRARRHVALALENGATPERRQLYAAKLGHLDARVAN